MTESLPVLVSSAGVILVLDAGSFATSLLTETFATWPDAMRPYFESKAQDQWGDKWESECAAILSQNMKQQLLGGGGWDACRIISVIVIKPASFMPDYEKLSDYAKEIYRQGCKIIFFMLITVDVQHQQTR